LPFLNPEAQIAYSNEELHEVFLQTSHAVYEKLEKTIGNKEAKLVYEESYGRLAKAFRVLDSFSVIPKLIPDPILDPDKISLLGRRQVEKLLKEKIISLKEHNREIYRKNRQLEKVRKELLHAKQKAEESSRFKERFLLNMSHEIRTPLNAIISINELLWRKSDPNSEEANLLNGIKSASEKLLTLINHLLDLSKIEAGKMDFEKVSFQLNDLVKGIAEIYAVEAKKKGVGFHVEIGKQVPNVLQGDPFRINQILMNFISNALKFTKEGSIYLQIEKAQNILEGGDWISFKVKDTGIGIPAEKLEHIFDSFTQVASSTTREFGGTGLGLAISKQLVELQNGRLIVESVPDKGSVFGFSLPFKLDPEKEQVIKSKEIQKETIHNFRLLVAEDDPLNQMIVQKLLCEHFDAEQLEMVVNGKQVIEMLEIRDFDIIIMDLEMPQMNGLETCQYIRKHFSPPKSGIPILGLTAHRLQEKKELCLKAGMNDCIGKPIISKILRQKIDFLILQSRQISGNN
ncbi:ATP-binding protein, partial [Xanthovirga aplysinae]|uniref:ATP-binding protein n=1 Tax=Xanthovirga aplysinae TaxID=2529853 RepID=UPI0012BB8AF6